MKKIILDEDLKYIDRNGNLLRSKTELSFSRLLSFLGKDYQYDFKIKLMNGNEVLVDFRVDNKYIEILDSEQDLEKFNEIKKNNPDLDIVAIGKSKFGVKSGDFETISASFTTAPSFAGFASALTGVFEAGTIISSIIM